MARRDSVGMLLEEDVDEVALDADGCRNGMWCG